MLQSAQMHQLLLSRLMAAALNLQPAAPVQVRGLGMGGVDYRGSPPPGPGVGIHLGFPLEKDDTTELWACRGPDTY